MTSPEAFRERFPIFDNKVFLNSCSKGALSIAVESAFGDYLDSWRGEGSPWEDWVSLLESTREAFARSIGCEPDEIAISCSASVAVAGLLSALDFTGDRRRIVIDDFEFPTMAHNFLTQDRRGAEIVRVRSRSGEIASEDYARALDERVLLAPVAHVCFRNGYKQDVEAVARAAAAVGAYSLIDDYQSTGTCPIDVKAMGCDFLVTGALKYLLGPSGVAFLYIRRELIERLEPVTTGWFGQARPFDFDIERATFHDSARRFETGTPPVPNLYAARAGLAELREVSASEVSSHVEALGSLMIAGARERGVRVLTPESTRHRGPLVVLGCRDPEAVVAALAAERIIVSARDNGLRVSFHYYNLEKDVDALWKALDRCSDSLEKESSKA